LATLQRVGVVVEMTQDYGELVTASRPGVSYSKDVRVAADAQFLGVAVTVMVPVDVVHLLEPLRSSRAHRCLAGDEVGVSNRPRAGLRDRLPVAQAVSPSSRAACAQRHGADERTTTVRRPTGAGRSL